MVKRKSRIVVGVLFACLLAATCISGALLFGKMNGYIEQSGEESVSTVIDQMQQTYDAHIEGHFNDLELTEAYLFQGGNRSIESGQADEFIDVMEQKTGCELVFLKDNGTATTADGSETRLEIQSQLLLDLRDGKSITKLVSRNVSGTQQDCFLIAIPCDDFYVDGQRYTAIGSIYDRSQIDALLKVNGYNGQAMLFLVDKAGEVTYTNLADDTLLRNYSLLKHLRKDDALTDGQVEELSESFAAGEKGVELLGAADRPYYMGHVPLRSSDATLVCIVAKTTTNDALLGYQKAFTRTTVVLGLLILVMVAALAYAMYRGNLSAQKARFEQERGELQRQSMRALEVEKGKAEAANKSKSEFLANMSHDIRTPMNAIVGLTQLMEHDKDDPEKMDAHIKQVQASSQHLLSLINDVLDMSRIESNEIELNRETLSLSQQVAQVEAIIRPQADERRQAFEVNVHGIAHDHVLGDAMRLRQLFINLLSNAVKYTQVGGTVRLEVCELEGADDGRARFRIVVADNGCGMAPEFVERMFEPFTRAENSTVNRVQGTGLGMAIVKRVVDMTGGTIDVDSELDRGSRFTVVLPLIIAEGDAGSEDEAGQPQELAGCSLDGLRLLCAEDNELNAEILEALLELHGARCTIYPNGQALVDAFAEVEPGQFDAILMDVQMPVMNGLDASRAIRSGANPLGRTIPIIAMTANAFESDARRCIDAGMDAHVAKPIDIDVLGRAIWNAKRAKG